MGVFTIYIYLFAIQVGIPENEICDGLNSGAFIVIINEVIPLFLIIVEKTIIIKKGLISNFHDAIMFLIVFHYVLNIKYSASRTFEFFQ